MLDLNKWTKINLILCVYLRTLMALIMLKCGFSDEKYFAYPVQ